MKHLWRNCLAGVLMLGMHQGAQAFELEDCHVEGIKQQILCGTLEVPEDPKKPSGKQIPLNITVLKGLNATPKTVPLLYLAGGPGQAATDHTAMVNMMFKLVRQSRDIVLVDQRGTGKSNGLQCTNMEVDGLGLDLDMAGMDLKQQARECIALFGDSDLTQYSTNQAVDDFEAVRKALGYEQFYLYGGSYGTRAGLVYMRRHPQSIAGAVLDSVAPTQLAVGLFGKTAEVSFDMLLKDCQENEACNKAFPNLKQDFVGLLNELKQQPKSVEVSNPVSAEQTTLLFDKDKFLNVLRTSLYAVQTRSFLPMAITQAAQGNYKPFLGLYSAIGTNGTGMYTGLTMTIVCSEDWPRISPARLAADNDNYVVGGSTGEVFAQMCSQWPRYEVEDSFAEPVKSAIPTLLLSGRVDPVTPPSYGDMAAESLSNARHLVSHNGAHTIISHTCAPKLVDQFLQTGELDKLDDSCLTRQYPTRFLISPNATGL